MRRFLVKLQFNGRNYNGWQRQSNARTVQGEVELALEKLFSQKLSACGCSRTDSGVSAEEYYFHFDADTKLPEERVAFKLNRFLPKDIQAQQSREVSPSFDARKSVKSKTYLYSVYCSSHLMPLYSATHHRIEGADVEKMRSESRKLIGTHDFTAFKNSSSEDYTGKSNVRTLNFIEIEETENRLYFYIDGDGFLYNMVRVICATLLDCGSGKISDIGEVLNSRDRKNAGGTLPAKALKLYRVNY